MALSNRNFLAAASHTIPIVGQFGEHLVRHMFGGRLVCQDSNFSDFADVYLEETKTAIQVKMCNQNHSQRPTAEQVKKIYNEVRDVKFLVDVRRALYVFVFYRGVHRTLARKNKSKILSRKISKQGKFEILAEEIQYIYCVEVDLLHELITAQDFPEIRKLGGCRVHHEDRSEKLKNRMILFFGRQFFKAFFENFLLKHKKILNLSFGEGKWCLRDYYSKVMFAGVNKSFTKNIPVFFIGRKTTNKKVIVPNLKPLVGIDIKKLDQEFWQAVREG